MKTRVAQMEDIQSILSLYVNAQKLLHSRGIDQWQDGYPNEASAKSDILTGKSYVLEENGKIIGTAYITAGTEPTYNKIFEGSWLCKCSKYVFIHRVAVDVNYSGKGLASVLFDLADEIAGKECVKSLRCDTHEDNIAMQKTLTRNGYQKCGIIFLEDGSKRLAYEKIIR